MTLSYREIVAYSHQGEAFRQIAGPHMASHSVINSDEVKHILCDLDITRGATSTAVLC